jgi:hypothetical protein
MPWPGASASTFLPGASASSSTDQDALVLPTRTSATTRAQVDQELENEAAEDILGPEVVSITEVSMEPGSGATSEGAQVFWDKSGVWEMWGGEWWKKTSTGWWQKWHKDGQ